LGRSGERRLRTVGVPEEEHRRADGLDHCDDILALIFKAVPFSCSRVSPAAAGDGS
jgi:hypothetical protein